MNDQKQALHALLKICMVTNEKLELFNEYINSCQKESKENTYVFNLNDTIEFVDDNEIYFLNSLAYDGESEDLEWRINLTLKNNFNLTIQLPLPNELGDDYDFCCKELFNIYDDIIKKSGFQISLLDRNEPEFIVIIHKTEDFEAVKNNFKKLGYDSKNINEFYE